MILSGTHRLPLLVVVAILIVNAMIVRTTEAAQYDRAADAHPFTVFMPEGGWCWYQDPRAIVHDGKLILGSVQGNGSGAALVGVYDLRQRKQLGTVVMQDHFDRDDHNSPVFYARPDGRVLAVYALHSRNRTHFYRISEPGNPLHWSAAQSFEHDYPAAGNVTYMNLYPLSAEGKLYNFFRGMEYNPSFVTSTDDGATWGEPTHFIADELQGRHRPYARYAGNGVDTVHVSFTDGHPRDFGNSIYYAAFRQGKFYRAEGELIKDLNQEGPLKPSEADLVFKGSGKLGRGYALSAPASAWTSSIALDSQGRPHIGYTLYITNADHRYRIASWDGSRWIDREVAFAGKCLYDGESSYTGLITLDPGDPATVLISTDVDPSAGADLGGHHEIYRAEIGLKDDIKTIQWNAITKDSPVRNLRPVIVRGEGYRVLTWLRGDFQTYRDYQLDVVGIIDE